MVFLRELVKTSITQADLKAQAGELLTLYCGANGFDPPLELGRCWRLDFFDLGFHMDVLPVIPDEEVPNGILLSDVDLRRWQYSHPIGYASWFYDRMDRRLFEERRVAMAKALGRSVDEVPQFLVRTPLQRVVQLLKRSRDEFFKAALSERPASVLVTTLAGHAYRGEEPIDDALSQVVAKMSSHIENRDGVWWVSNPAHRAARGLSQVVVGVPGVSRRC
jgi:hypothetical protein